MNKFIFAFVAFLAVAQAKPYGGSLYNAPSVSYQAPSLAYQAVPVQSSYSVPSSYGTYGSNNYGSNSYAVPSIQLQPIAIPYSSSNYGVVAPTPLVAAPSNPSASAAAAAAAGQLNSGNYAQLAVPSYEIVSGIPASIPVYGSTYGSNYGSSTY